MKIRLDAADVGRVRFADAPAPVLETAMMMFELTRLRLGDRQPSWRADVLRAFPTEARPLRDLFRPTRAVYFLDVMTPDVREGFAAVSGTSTAGLALDADFVWPDRDRMPCWVRRLAAGDTDPRRIVDRALRAFHASCVTPLWSYATTKFAGDVGNRLEVVRRSGATGLLNSLSDDIRFDGHVLEVGPHPGEIHTNGNGLLLMPSAFWTGPSLITIDQQDLSQCVLIYAAQAPDVESCGTGDSLAALLGVTRARVLRAVFQPRSTSGIAECARISVSSASQHAAILRDAGLIISRRRGKIVEHHVTDLGMSLLRSAG